MGFTYKKLVLSKNNARVNMSTTSIKLFRLHNYTIIINLEL